MTQRTNVELSVYGVSGTGSSVDLMPNNSVRGSRDLRSQYQEALDYKFQKNVYDLQKNAALQEQQLAFKVACQQIMQDYHSYQQLMGFEIYKSTSGDLMFAITDPDKRRVKTTQLLNVRDYRVRRLVSYHPRQIAVLEITWGHDEAVNGFFWPVLGAKSVGTFLSRLKSHGVLLLVSGRTEKQAADALLAYSYMSAQEVQIAYTYGWGLIGNGKWHFARLGDLVMTQVLDYV